MFIIWGWGGRVDTIGSGEFVCPACRTRTVYQHKCVRNYFRLFFLPLFPVDAGQRFVECERCGGTFKDVVLAMDFREEESHGEDRYGRGERVLGRRDNYWYPGHLRMESARGMHVRFDDGQESVLPAARVIPFDLRIDDPVFARKEGGKAYFPGTLVELNGKEARIRFEDGTEAATPLASVRVLWDDGSG